jgi:flagellar hook assembly protein FlgD
LTVTATATSGPEGFFVSLNLLNPSQGPVSIHVTTYQYPGAYELVIYNSAGEHIRTLDYGQLVGPIDRTYTWDGTNKFGAKVASGLYAIYLTKPFGRLIARILVIR